MSTKDLINAIATGDAIEIEATFNSVMAEKIAGAIEDRRMEVAQNLFSTPQQEEPVAEE